MRVIDKGARPALPPSSAVPAEYVALMQSCWSQKAVDRPSFTQALARLVNMAAVRK